MNRRNYLLALLSSIAATDKAFSTTTTTDFEQFFSESRIIVAMVIEDHRDGSNSIYI
jgi:hypothetical protein